MKWFEKTVNCKICIESYADFWYIYTTITLCKWGNYALLRSETLVIGVSEICYSFCFHVFWYSYLFGKVKQLLAGETGGEEWLRRE